MLKDKGNKDELKLKNIVIKNAVGNPIVRRDLLKLVSVDGERSCFVSGDLLKHVSMDDERSSTSPLSVFVWSRTQSEIQSSEGVSPSSQGLRVRRFLVWHLCL